MGWYRREEAEDQGTGELARRRQEVEVGVPECGGRQGGFCASRRKRHEKLPPVLGSLPGVRAQELVEGAGECRSADRIEDSVRLQVLKPGGLLDRPGLGRIAPDAVPLAEGRPDQVRHGRRLGRRERAGQADEAVRVERFTLLRAKHSR